MLALATAAAAGLAMGAIWLGLALLVEETRKGLTAQFAVEPQKSAEDAFPPLAVLSLDIAANAAMAAAPAIAWFSRAPIGAPLAAAMLGVLFAATLRVERRGAAHAAAAAAPYAGLALLFLIDGLLSGHAAAALAYVLTMGFAFASLLFTGHRSVRALAHERAENEELIRQFNATSGDPNAAVWEIDFAARTLQGGERLAQIMGRPVTFDELIAETGFAAPEDFDVAELVFKPRPGAMSRIVVEHAVIDAQGARVRVRHQGVVRTTQDGAPLRVTCTTRRADHAATAAMSAPAGMHASLLEAARNAGAALSAQAELLRTLSNELSEPMAHPGDTPALDFGAETSFADTCEGVSVLIKQLADREQQVERSVDALAHARHAADAANLAKSQFLANMSHELRTPLNAIIGYAEILEEDAEEEGNKAAVQDCHRILGAAKHLLSLINEILDLSKIEAGRMDVSVAPFDPCELIDDVLDTMRPLAEKNGNVLEWSSARVDGEANSDSRKLGQCLLNFLSNACKFTKNGRVEISYERRALDGVDNLFFCVRDTGIGMSPDQVARLFQPFVQADPSITQQFGGTGLGLTITQRFAQMLGGEVEVHSTQGQGSVFTLRVPANYSAGAAASGAATEIDELQGSPDAPLVIVIEDEPDARELAARALTRAGFSVLGVGGGDSGLALAREKAPALVLLDIFLPDRSGWRVLQSLKHDPKTCDIPVVVLSVNDDRAHALSLGAAEHMVKPADRDVLAATVMRFARKRPAPLAAAATASTPIKTKTA